MPQLPTPTNYALVAGAAVGKTRLTAFDRALLASGVGNLNLIRVTSVLPPGAVERDKVELAPGALCTIAYGTISSGVAGQTIAAAVGVGICRGSFGMIMEFSGECSREEAERIVRGMVEEAFANRDLPLGELKVKAAEITVPEGQVAAAFAGVPLWG
ncbi:MAG: arginine decarboxylase, pyruvoyl-dependent [Firmicutes bacterium]|nr:arginine decarboxylase, pyruvoyl-dependent [Bacillota bacterium]